LAQGTRLGYVITGYLNKETSSDTEINPNLIENRDDFAGPNVAYEPTKDKNPMNIEPTSHQFKTYKKADFGSTFLNLTKKDLSFVAERPHTIDVPNDQVLRGHTFSPHGNVNFIAKGSVKQHQEDVKDLNHKHEPQLKERSTLVNDLLGASYTIRSRADRHHDLIEGTQWGGECSYPKVLNMTTPNKSSSSQVGNSTTRTVAPTAYENC